MSNNDSYTTGFFTDTTLDIYNSDGTLAKTLTNTGTDNTSDCFITKYNANGFLQWATQIGGTSNSEGLSISTDSNNNVFVTGYFRDTTLDIYNSDGTLAKTLTNKGTNRRSDCFITKYNANGFLQWATQIGGTLNSFGISISTDSNNNVFVTGFFNDITLYIYNSDGTLAKTLTNTGTDNTTDCFITKYNANGFLQWATQIGGTSSSEGNSICCSKNINTPPISNICFLENTPILLDQGIIDIQEINTDIHTINNKKIVAITKTISLDNYLVCFHENALGANYPIKKTIISKDHKILYYGKMIEAYKFIGHFDKVKKMKYNGEVLYNILMENHEKINVNNLICETLHPKNIIAKIYNSKLSEKYKNKIIIIMNNSIKNNDYLIYKKITNHVNNKI